MTALWIEFGQAPLFSVNHGGFAWRGGGVLTTIDVGKKKDREKRVWIILQTTVWSLIIKSIFFNSNRECLSISMEIPLSALWLTNINLCFFVIQIEQTKKNAFHFYSSPGRPWQCHNMNWMWLWIGFSPKRLVQFCNKLMGRWSHSKELMVKWLKNCNRNRKKPSSDRQNQIIVKMFISIFQIKSKHNAVGGRAHSI